MRNQTERRVLWRAGDDDDVAVGAGVAIDELLEPGRRDRRPAEQPDLVAMGMPGQLQRDPRRHPRRIEAALSVAFLDQVVSEHAAARVQK